MLLGSLWKRELWTSNERQSVWVLPCFFSQVFFWQFKRDQQHLAFAKFVTICRTWAAFDKGMVFHWKSRFCWPARSLRARFLVMSCQKTTHSFLFKLPSWSLPCKVRSQYNQIAVAQGPPLIRFFLLVQQQNYATLSVFFYWKLIFTGLANDYREIAPHSEAQLAHCQPSCQQS